MLASLRETDTENAIQSNLFLQRHLQLPNQWHGKNGYHEVDYEIDCGRAESIGKLTAAVATRNGPVPSIGQGLAQ